MPKPRNLYAFSMPGSDAPAYISVNERAGSVEITVRSDKGSGGETAVIALSHNTARALARSVIMKLPATNS